MYRKKLEAAGLIRSTPHRSYRYTYGLIRPEDLPMLQPALKAWDRERPE